MHSLGKGLFSYSCIILSVICKTGSHAIQLHLLTVMSLRGNWFTSVNEDAPKEAVQHFSFCYLQVLIPNIYRDVFLIFTDSYSLTEGSAKGVAVIKTLWTY